VNDRATDAWTVRRLLEWTAAFFTRKHVDSPRLSAELLLSHVLGIPRIGLYTNYERVVAEQSLASFRDLVKRAGEDEPIAYLTGRAPFFNLEFEVSRDVLIPRADTETLVEHVLQLARMTSGMESPRVLDLCTGSGCIAAAIAHHLKSAIVIATDVSAPAAEIATRNMARLGLAERVNVLAGDLFAPLDSLVDRAQPFDMIVSNPPYIPSREIDDLDRSVRDYEPRVALDGGPDGLDLHRRILELAPARLTAGGRVFLEIAFDQGPAAMEIAQANQNFCEARIIKDNAGRDRVLTARKQ
jgi:release factor glutamine methyltransferase